MSSKRSRDQRSTAFGEANRWLWGAALVALVAVVYAPAFDAGFIWDDGQHVLHNPVLKSGYGLVDIWLRPTSIPQYYPLTHTTFWIESRLWGVDPRGYHAVNVALHALAVILLWRLLSRLQVPGAWLAAAIFAVHPVGVESVAWITERKNLLSLVFSLASMLAYMRFTSLGVAPPAGATDPAQQRWYGVSLALFVAALLSKTIAASVPAVLLVITWWKEGNLARQARALAPFFAIGLVLAAVTVWLERTHVGAAGPEYDLAPAERVFVAGRAIWFYVFKLIWPVRLMFFYPRWTIDTGAIWQYSFPVGVVFVVLGLWLARRRIGRGPLAASLIFAGVLLPALGFIDVFPFRYSFVADHFQYHASIALIALAAAGAALAATAVARRTGIWLPAVVACAVIGVLGMLAYERTKVFQDVRTLYEDTLAHNPGSWVAHANLGEYWLDRREPLKAQAEYEEALKTVPAAAAWQTHLGLGNCQQDQRLPAEALVYYTKALEVCPPRQQAEVHLHIAGCLQDLGRNREAIDHYEQAQKLHVGNWSPTPILNMAVCLHELGDLDRAIESYRLALARGYPSHLLVMLRLADCLIEAGQSTEAIRVLEYVAPRLREPTPARLRLATALSQEGKTDQAVALLEQILQARPAGEVRIEALDRLGNVYAAAGRWDEAVVQYRAALQIRPDDPRTLRDLGKVLVLQGRMPEALEKLRAAVEKNPSNAAAQHALGKALQAVGDTEAANAALQTAYDLRPRLPEYRAEREPAAASPPEANAAGP